MDLWAAACGIGCIWAEHAWGGRRVVEAGVHPMRGPYRRSVAQCQCCGRELEETDWLRLPTMALYSDGQRNVKKKEESDVACD